MQGSTPHVGVIDWRNKNAADYYVKHVIGLATATDKHIDGVFVDSGFPIAGSTNLTYASRKASECDGAFLALHRVRAAASVKCAGVRVATKAHSCTYSDAGGAGRI
jgi:hypothetical protein